MALTKISGPVSNFREETQVQSATSTTGAMGMGRTTFRTKKIISFRVGKKPVVLKLTSGSIDLTDGDDATVVGTESSKGMNAIMVRNDGTGICYSMSFLYFAIWGVALTVLALATLLSFSEVAIIGLIVGPIGLYMLYKTYQLKQAQELIST